MYAAKLLFLRFAFELVLALAVLVAAFETLDPSGGVDDFLLAGEERMTGGAQIDLHLLGRAAGLEGVTTGAGHLDVLIILRM